MKATTKITEKEQTIVKIVKTEVINLEMTKRDAVLLCALIGQSNYVDSTAVINHSNVMKTNANASRNEVVLFFDDIVSSLKPLIS